MCEGWQMKKKRFFEIDLRRSIGMMATVLSIAALPSIAWGGAGYDGGFFIKNEDDTFRLDLTGGVKTAFFLKKATDAPSVLSFQIQGAWIDVGAAIHEKAKAGFTLLHAVGSVPQGAGQPNATFQTANVTGAFIEYGVIPEFVVTAGMVGLPLDMGVGCLLTGYPITSTQIDGEKEITPLRGSFGAPAGLGVRLSGDIWRFRYEVGVVNGAESNYEINADRKMSPGLRLAFDILDPAGSSPSDTGYSETPKLSISTGTICQGKKLDAYTDADIKYQWTSTAGARFKWRGLAITTQGYYRRSRFTSIGSAQWLRPRLTDIGYYAGAGYFVLPKKLELAAQAGQVVRQGPDNDAWQFGGGINWYIFEGNLVLKADYTLTTDFDDITGTQSNRIHVAYLQLVASF